MYAQARDRGDAAGAAQYWEQLAIRNVDRMKGIVKAFRFGPGGKPLPQADQGSAVSEAFIRVLSMGPNFEGREIGVYYAALVTCVQNACRDFGRKELRHKKHWGGSLDQTYDDDGEAGPFDKLLADYDKARRAELEDTVESELAGAYAADLIAWGISQIENDNYREVLELTHIEQLTAEQIADRLGITLDNVYARRSRGLKELERILREGSA